VELEKALFREAGFEVDVAQCRTEDDVIAAAKAAPARSPNTPP
jgi:hypothetical protein